MRVLLSGFAGFCAALSRAALLISGAGLVVMTAIVSAQVFWRYALNAPLIWSEPASVLIMGWFIFLGAAVGVRENFHMGFDVLVYILPASTQPWMKALSDLATLVFGIAMLVYGIELSVKTWGSALPVVHIPSGSTYLPLAAAGVLITLFSLERLALRAAGVQIDRPLTVEDAVAGEI